MLQAELEKDRTKTYLVEISPLGLVEMTRQNVTEGVREILTAHLPDVRRRGRRAERGDDGGRGRTAAAQARPRVGRPRRSWSSMNAKVASLPGRPGRRQAARARARDRQALLARAASSTCRSSEVDVIARGHRAPRSTAKPCRSQDGDERTVKIAEPHMYNTTDGVARVDGGYPVVVGGAIGYVGQEHKVRIDRATRTMAFATLLDAKPTAIELPPEPGDYELPEFDREVGERLELEQRTRRPRTRRKTAAKPRPRRAKADERTRRGGRVGGGGRRGRGRAASRGGATRQARPHAQGGGRDGDRRATATAAADTPPRRGRRRGGRRRRCRRGRRRRGAPTAAERAAASAEAAAGRRRRPPPTAMRRQLRSRTPTPAPLRRRGAEPAAARRCRSGGGRAPAAGAGAGGTAGAPRPRQTASLRRLAEAAAAPRAGGRGGVAARRSRRSRRRPGRRRRRRSPAEPATRGLLGEDAGRMLGDSPCPPLVPFRALMYAVIKVGGKQYRVEQGQKLLVDRQPHAAGETFTPEVLMTGGDDVVDRPRQAAGHGHRRRWSSICAARRSRCSRSSRSAGFKKTRGHRSELSRIADRVDRRRARPSPSGAAAQEGGRGQARRPAARRRRRSRRRNARWRIRRASAPRRTGATRTRSGWA